MGMEKMIKAFEEHLMETGSASKTIESYVGDIKMFGEYIREKGVVDWRNFRRLHFVHYKHQLLEKGYAIPTINKKVNSLQAFNRFLIENGVLSGQVVDLAKDRVKVAWGSGNEVEILAEEDIQRLLLFIQDRSKVTLRNGLIIHLLLYTGIRVSELCQIKQKDLDFLTSALNVLGKGRKFREVPLRADLVDLIKEYLKTERSQSRFAESEYLLVSQRNPKIARDSINTLLEHIGEQLGMTLYPHLFRHTFCSRLLKKGVDIATVSRLAGHQSVNITSDYYINTSRQDKLEAVNLL
jgi:integrase/recombinase XerD